MMPNSKPWEAIVNAHSTTISQKNANTLSVVKQNNTKADVLEGRVVNPKRYSFDDNGGGYLGL